MVVVLASLSGWGALFFPTRRIVFFPVSWFLPPLCSVSRSPSSSLGQDYPESLKWKKKQQEQAAAASTATSGVGGNGSAGGVGGGGGCGDGGGGGGGMSTLRSGKRFGHKFNHLCCVHASLFNPVDLLLRVTSVYSCI